MSNYLFDLKLKKQLGLHKQWLSKQTCHIELQVIENNHSTHTSTGILCTIINVVPFMLFKRLESMSIAAFITGWFISAVRERSGEMHIDRAVFQMDH